MGKWLRGGIRFYAALGAGLLTLFVVWMILGLPLFFDRISIRSEISYKIKGKI